MAHLSMASWRGYTNLILERTKYVGYGIESINRGHISLGMVERSDPGEFESFFLANEKDMPRGDISLEDYNHNDLHRHIISNLSTLGL